MPFKTLRYFDILEISTFILADISCNFVLPSLIVEYILNSPFFSGHECSMLLSNALLILGQIAPSALKMLILQDFPYPSNQNNRLYFR